MANYVVDTSWITSSTDLVFWCERNRDSGELRSAGLSTSGDYSADRGWVHVCHIRLGGVQVRLVQRGLDSGSGRNHRLEGSRDKDPLVKMLKSHLQKAIRRQLSDLAVASAAKLLEYSAESLLRRLPIIIIEDATMVPELLPLVWLLVAYGRRGLSAVDVEWILGVVKLVTEFGWWDNISANPPPTWQVPDIASLANNNTSPIVGMAIRLLYGGMSCDMEMLRRYIYTWQQRSNSSSNDKRNKKNNLIKQLVETRARIEPISPDSTIRLSEETMLHNCIDHHCSSIVYLLEKSYPINSGNSSWKDLIWYNSSALNTRIRITTCSEQASLLHVWTGEQMDAYDSAARDILATVVRRGGQLS